MDLFGYCFDFNKKDLPYSGRGAPQGGTFLPYESFLDI